MTAVTTRPSTELVFFDAAGPELAAHFAEHGYALLRDALSADRGRRDQRRGAADLSR